MRLEVKMSRYYYPEDRVAIIAMGGLFPDAKEIDTLWRNILDKKISIREIPDRFYDKNLFYKPELFGKANKQNKSYTNIAAVPEIMDNTALLRKYKIPPAVAEYMDPNQHATIYCVDQVMQNIKSNVPKERTAVILNTSAPGYNFENVVRRTFLQRVESEFLNHPELKSNPMMNKIESVFNEVQEKLLIGNLNITEDSTTGYLQNLTAGRISNIFDFQGPSFTVDSACASALTAIAISVSGLLNHEYDLALTGGVEVTLTEVGLVAFSAINALSPDGSYPFDSRANGFVMGLGGGIVALKRLSDAIRDGDYIYSIISGYGQGSDGKGKYIAAPSSDGQVRVIKSAIKMAGYSAETIEMIETHGTGTSVGDVSEITALKNAFNDLGVTRKNYCGVGSIKSNIGHLRNAAGVAGVIKATMALHNKILPPTANIKEINPKLKIEDSPFYILTDGMKWNEQVAHPRRANVSSFGFGGADYHICLEEFRSEFVKKTYSINDSAFKKGSSADNAQYRKEVVFFAGNTYEDIKESYETFIQNGQWDFEKAALSHNMKVSAGMKIRVAVCASSYEDLKAKWSMVCEQLDGDKKIDDGLLAAKGIYIGTEEPVTPDKISIMFPGQASQYPNMLKELYESYPIVKSFYTQVDNIWKSSYGYSLMPLIFGDDEDGIFNELRNTKNTHPAIFLSNMAIYKLLEETGIKADYMIGHSLGEITSFYAGEILDLKSAIHMVGERGYCFDKIDHDKRGQMLSVKADKSDVARIINEYGINVRIANMNSYVQTIVGGEASEIERFMKLLSDNNIVHTLLNVSHAFHTELIKEAAEDFYNKIKGLRFNKPKAKIMACHLKEFYSDIADIASLLKEQITSPVNFIDSIEKLYDEGVRVFIESGPSNVLTNLVKNILDNKDVKVIPVNYKGKDSVESFKLAIASLFACGVDVTMVPTYNILESSDKPLMNMLKGEDNSALSTNNISSSNVLSSNVSSNNIVSNTVLQNAGNVVYSGVSVGLPGTFKKAFSDDNFDILFEGTNLIEMLTEEEQNSILDLNITRILKTEEKTEFRKVSSINEMIKFAGKFGQMSMIEDYLMDEKMLKQTCLAACAGIAAGYEALKDAGIPLVREYIKTASGSLLPGRLVLPQEMREDTGIIFANGLFPIDNVINQVSQYIASKFGSKSKMDIIDFYSAVISKISDREAKKILTDWFNAHYSKLVGSSTEQDIYEFNHNFITVLSSQANNRFAQLIGATGPNLYVNTACASTASAVSIAEDMIKTGRAERVIVIGADISSTKSMLPWIGAGFFSIGVLSDSHDLFEAAVPFDNRRNGMILGSGAVGLVLEKEHDVEKRGMKGICRILGTHMFNSAGHSSKIDTNRHCIELDRFMAKMEKQYGIERNGIASKTVYCSHETYSPKNGGCGQMEKRSLEYVFGERFKDIKVINTKGMTGHTMGASIEEALSAKALQYQKIPPISNYKVEDPELSGLNLSKGGSYQFEYVLRGVSAFGGNGSYHLLQKICHGDERIFDKTTYENWIKRIVDSDDAKLKKCGRILVAEESDACSSGKTNEIKSMSLMDIKEEGFHDSFFENNYGKSLNNDINEFAQGFDIDETAVQDYGNVEEEVLKVYSEITKYPVEMLDMEMELEADLGIDTVKQATIFSMLSEKFGLNYEGSVALSNYPTIGHIVKFLHSKTKGKSENKGLKDENKESESKNIVMESQNKVVSSNSGNRDIILDIISEITMYPKEMLENEMEFEADLGIDTIKQASIFSKIGEKFKIEDTAVFNPSKIKTIGSIIELVESNFNADIDNNDEKATENNKAAEDNIERELCIQVPVVEEEDITSKDFDIQKKNILIIGDNRESLESAAHYFGAYTDNLSIINFTYPVDMESLEKQIETLANNNIDVIIDLTHIGLCIDFTKLSIEEENKYLTLSSEARFVFYKNLLKAVKKPKIRIVAAVCMDGGFGFTDNPDVIHDPFYGAICGFYKGLGKEFTDCVVKVLDIGASKEKILGDEDLSKILNEIEACSTYSEVGYIGSKRVVIKLDNLDRSELKNDLNLNGDHFLITGGGNGITAEIIKGLSKRVTGKFTILGRTPLPPDIEEISRMDEASLEKKKVEIRRSLLEKGLKATPIEVQREYDKILKSISVYTVMNELKSKNCSVLYIDCDVSDYDRLKSALDSAINAHGPINVLVHAAGIEKSNLLNKKTLEEFNEIFNVKAKGLCNLYRLVNKNDLNVIVGFSSISGRFGNQAQIDYCSANSFITSFMSMAGKENKDVQAISIAWSGWRDMGMAWRNEFVKSNSEELGIHLIEPDRGVKEFINLLTSRLSAAEFVMSRGLGSFKEYTVIKESTLKTPFIDWVSKKDGKIQNVYKVLSVKRDPIIKNHLLGNTPLMPAVGFMEICAEFHSLLYGRKKQYCFKDITLTNPLKLHRENPQEIIMVPSEIENDWYNAIFYNYFQPKNMEGRLNELNNMKFSGLLGSYQDIMYLKKLEDKDMREYYVRDLLEEQSKKIKNGIGFGPLFMDDNCIKLNKVKIDEDSIVYSVFMSEEQITNKQYNLDNLLINPVFMDSLMQACGIHSAEVSGKVHLPWKIDEFGVVNVPRTLGNYRAYGKLISQNDEMKTYDVIMFDENDDVNYYTKGVIVRRINS